MSQSAAYRRFLSRGDLRRRRRDRRIRRQQKTVPCELVKLTAEEKRRMVERKEYIDAAVAYLANYSWSYFVTLTFGEPQGPESIDRAVKRFTHFVHENVFGEFDAVKDVRDLYGIRYLPAQERGRHGQKRLHAHLVMCGGEVLGERLDNAKWLPWAKWWNKNYGGLKIEKPESQADVVAYCTKYMLKGVETGFELCSTWADERDRRKRAEAPLLQERKVGIDVTRSAELERSAYRCESPHGTGPTSKGGGKPCRRCGLVSLCRCWSGTTESGQVYGPESDAGAARAGSGELVACAADRDHAGAKVACSSAAPLPTSQLSLPLQGQLLPLHVSANKTVLAFSSPRFLRLARRRRRFESRSVTRHAVSVAVNAVCTYPNGI